MKLQWYIGLNCRPLLRTPYNKRPRRSSQRFLPQQEPAGVLGNSLVAATDEPLRDIYRSRRRRAANVAPSACLVNNYGNWDKKQLVFRTRVSNTAKLTGPRRAA